MVSMKRHEQGNWIDDDHGWVAPGHGARQHRTRWSAMKWWMHFYNERRGILIRWT
jgi:hypothetical protein